MINLNQKYDRADFVDFLQNTFLGDYARDVRPVSTQGLSAIGKAVSLGRSESLDLQVFEFEYSGSANKRVTLTKEAFQLMRQSATFNALAIFYGQNSDDWRLSFLTANPQKTEKGKVTLAYSNPRRYSFFLGASAKVNTPTKFLINRGKIVSFEDLKSRFSIEVVNKEFYKEISKAFIQLSNGLLKLPSTQEKSQTNLEFAVRLIGRIIFCWFLREKKGNSTHALMPKELLSLDAVSKNEDYYHQILEPIFFEVLNKPIPSRRSEFTKEPFSFVPYLNGGLFTPQDDDFYKRSNGDMQSQFHNTLVIPDSWLKEFFETLETYNFTIDENITFDEELSIDPEMLGRIFENLLAEINPETGESARKATGSYYTPRTIVNYMVDESLCLYLKQKTDIEEKKLRAIISYDLTDDTEYPITQEEKEKIIDALETLKLLDPACGSGAFPIGALQKIVFILQQIDPDGQLWFKRQLIRTSPELRRVIEREFEHQNFDYIRKLGIIRENIYGIDIQPIATEIARLRCFLTLIVDERVQDDLENRGIEPLPNLDFKFVTANSLIGLPTSRNTNQMGLFEDDEGIKQLKELRDMFFTATGVEREQLKLQFVQAQNRMFQRMIEEGRKGYADLTTRLSSWDPFSHKISTWFDPEWMFGIKGFDVVIGNPPYGSSVRDTLRNNIIEHLGKVPDFEIYYFFIEEGRELLHDKGLLTYIIPNTFLFNVFASQYRKRLLKNWGIKEIMDCTNFKLFESATVHNAIIIFSKDEAKEIVGYKNTKDADNFDELVSRETLYIKPEVLEIYNQNWGLVFKLQERTLNIVEKIKTQSKELKSFFPEISQGLIAYDKYRGQKKEVIERRAYHYDKKMRPDLKSWLHGEDVRKYIVQWNGKEWIDYSKDIANPRQPKFFKGKRILVREITNPSIYAAYTEEELYGDPSIITILDNSNGPIALLYLLGILNSKLATFYHFNASPKATKGSFPKILVKDIQEFPIKEISNEEQKNFVEIVTKIINLRKSDLLKSQDYEEQVNQLIYRFYGLTAEEIAIVEGHTN